jgi:hypothetical protein
MKSIAILVFAVALEAGFLLTLTLPAPVLARAGTAMREKVVQLARATHLAPAAPVAHG